ncbi:hypothetical protein AAM22_gp09 [Pantoea phage vB_PagM_AAM22]|nr:hypothetical protein AAM22_gp09 [Pantoea phage vB_PagM_AAM22]
MSNGHNILPRVTWESSRDDGNDPQLALTYSLCGFEMVTDPDGEWVKVSKYRYQKLHKMDNLQSRVNDEKLAQSAGYVNWDEFNQIEAKNSLSNSDIECNDANLGDALKEMFDTVQRPAHYNQSGIECIDAIAASMTPAEFQAYLKGNVQKYLWRYQHKNGLEDCRKAQWYLDRLVKELSK